jgi:hypothetical protein
MVSRRQFLKTGILGGAVLALAGAWYWRGHDSAGRLGGTMVLDDASRAIVAALVPVLLSQALPQGEAGAAVVAQTVDGVSRAVGGLSHAAQQEVGELFALLDFPPTRIVVAGVMPPWSEATPAQIASFLTSWRFSRFRLLQSAYAALHDLILGAWYGHPDSWPAIDYPGPPEVL